MEALHQTTHQPRTLSEFQLWEPNDDFKYEWNDGEIIQFTGMNKNQVYIASNNQKLVVRICSLTLSRSQIGWKFIKKTLDPT